MGKKKSVVLMTLITIVLVVLCALTVVPAFSFPWNDGVNGWQSAIEHLDLGADFEGGYYAYYYPEGVISETEYQSNLDNKEEGSSEYEDYQADYVKHKGLYLAKDEKYGIFDDEDKATSSAYVSADFKSEIQTLRDVISARYAQKGYDTYRVSVVDDYALKVEIPASDAAYENTLTTLALTGSVSIKLTGETIAELEGEDIKDYIKGFAVKSYYKYKYLEVQFTSKGKEFIAGQKDSLSASSSSSSSNSATTLDIYVGDQSVGFSMYSDSIVSDNSTANLSGYQTAAYTDQLETYAILLNSALNGEESTISFSDVSSEIREMENVHGNNIKTLVLIALAIAILLAIVLPIVKYGRYGVTCAYATVSYVVIAGLCFAFISSGTFVFTLGTVLTFLAGLIIINVLNAYIYKAIKAEFDLGKTVASAVSLGYKKTLLTVVDVYAVLILGALALLIGAAGVHTMALQALICFVAGAFCNLLWTRFINFTHLSASTDKYKYFRFVREDDDDE